MMIIQQISADAAYRYVFMQNIEQFWYSLQVGDDRAYV